MILVLSLAPSLVAAPLAAAIAAPAVPVRYGGDAARDACDTLATVTGLDPRGDNYLSVRSGPGGAAYREQDHLRGGQQVWICEERGVWLGIVYRRSTTGADCGVGMPRRRAGPYRGPCRAGWVHSRYVRTIAG